MTKVVISKKDGHIVSVDADGHTGYGAEGEDIVCAALSSIIQTAVLGLMRVAGLSVGFETEADGGILRLTIPELSDEDRHNADMILNTMLCGVADLYEGYSDYIELEVK